MTMRLAVAVLVLAGPLQAVSADPGPTGTAQLADSSASEAAPTAQAGESAEPDALYAAPTSADRSGRILAAVMASI